MPAEPTVFDVRNFVLALIRGGKLGPDNRLPTERELCVASGAGRRLVRRALASLEAEGLIWRRQGKGTFAGQPVEPIGALAAEVNRLSKPIEVMEARLCIEPTLASLCAQRARPEEVMRMRAIAQRQLEAGDDEMIEVWDSALHRLIAKSARNQPLLTAFAMLDEIRANADWNSVRARARSEVSLHETRKQHLSIIDAIEAGNPENAGAAMRTHLMTRFRAMSNEVSRRAETADDEEDTATEPEHARRSVHG
ncbi:FadR/GntR family transcriptional regulator [Pseudoruegeria sp. HB172150]|uniref:FadR/GntR family transcriptional regulator n=1 Tax=Pseudoruegeria sp. HB172150 TaxID=2721164 RepID=UPI0015558618|nr:FCD domain-containing protein [Pseudoruegeria sp. HB172150]